MNADEIKEDSNSILAYLKTTIDSLDPRETIPKTDMRYMEYDPRTDKIVVATSLFDDMYWLQQYYNAVMRSAMNHHFKAILEEKGYKVLMNDNEGKHVMDTKKLKEEVKDANNAVVKRAIDDADDSLTASEKKIKSSMEKRAGILKIKINNEQFRDELADDRKFTTHLNLCSLLNTHHDDIMIAQMYKELDVQNIKSNTMKLKLINDIQTSAGVSPLCIDNINNVNVVISEEKQQIIKKVFRIKEVTLVAMYRNLLPGLVKAQTTMVNNVRERRYEVDPKVMKHHLDLLHHRSKKFTNIDHNVFNYFNYTMPVDKKLI